MRRLTKIEPKKAQVTMKKVAAYCRVSTGSDAQEESLETQREHYESYIKCNPEWEYAGLYYDDGITGTKKDKRPGLLKLLADAHLGKINLVLTKSISRFSRNTIDCLNMVRELSEIGVAVFFEKEQIDTSRMDDEVLLTILGSLAQNESVSTSENEKWAIRHRFENGTFKEGMRSYGYDVVDGQLIIKESEAKVVKHMYELALSGLGCYKIAKKLNEEEIPSFHGTEWSAGSVTGILTNERNMGDRLYQKTFTDSNFNRHKNRGEQDMFYHEDHHAAIVDKDTFNKVQELIEKRKIHRGIDSEDEKYQNRYLFSHRIICGECGHYWKRKIVKGRVSGPYICWVCSMHVADKDICHMKAVEQVYIEDAFTTMVNKLITTRRQLLEPFVRTLQTADEGSVATQMEEVDAALTENTDKAKKVTRLAADMVLDAAAAREAQAELNAERLELNTKKATLAMLISERYKGASEAGTLLKEIYRREPGQKFDPDLFETIVDHIVIQPGNKIDFVLKCGLTLQEVIRK